MKKIFKNPRLTLASGGLLLYLVATGISYAVFSAAKTSVVVSPLSEGKETTGVTTIDTSGPRDQECPLNGAYFTKGEREVWEKRRPLAVMIENHTDSRPQSGLSRADVVYEAVAEGGISRFLAVFYCGAAVSSAKPYDVGPVRSARTYFLDWASEYADYPLYLHVGGAGKCDDPTVAKEAKALCQIEQYGWKDKGSWSDLDQFSLPYQACHREMTRTGREVATEHTMYCDTANVWKIAEERGLTNETAKTGEKWDESFRPWLFKEEAALEERGEPASPIKVYFWSNQPQYEVAWEYNREENVYKRFNGGQEHIDFLTGQPLTAKVVVVQFAKETTGVDDHKHLLYKTTGEGEALIFQDGKVTEATWEKPSRTSRTIFSDKSGREIRFNRGQIWVEVVPAGNKITY